MLVGTDALGALVMLTALAVLVVLVVPGGAVMEAVPLGEPDVVTAKTMSYSPTEGVGTLSVHAVLLSPILRALISACGISSAPAPGIPNAPKITPGVSVENTHTAPP